MQKDEEISYLRDRVSFLEVEEKKKNEIENELIESKRILNSIINTIPDIVYRLDVDGKITFINDVIRNYNYDPKELIGKYFSDLVHPDDLEKSKYCVKERRTGERSTKSFEFRMLTAEQKEIPFEIRSRGIYDEHVFLLHAEGIYKPDSANEMTFMGTQGLARDISKYKRMKAQLRQSQKMEAVGLLAGGVAHDFNNLLTVITGYTDILLATVDTSEAHYKKLRHIKDSAESASKLTAQLLAFSRRQILKPKVINLNDIIVRMEDLLVRIIKENVTLRLVLAENLKNIKSDPLQIEQIVMNLAANANDAMENGGVLTIETKNVVLDKEYEKKHIAAKSGEFVHLLVSDTGRGIDEKILDKIFEPFFTTKEMGRGTGLGLATVYGIVKQSGGNIWVDSKADKGTVFNLFLPQSMENLYVESSVVEKKKKLHGGETLLIVEDQDDILELISDTLTETGYNVIAACCANEGLEKIEKYNKKIDLLLTDVILPDMNGYELSLKVLKIHPDVEIVYMSGYADDAIARLGVMDIDKHFIQKPFSPLKLADKIHSILDK